MRSTSTATALAVLFSSVALSVAATGPAAAAVATVTSPGGIVVDGTLKRVFVGDNGRVLAADYSGNVVDTVTGLGSVADLALSADGRTLYASLPARHQIVALDTVTLNITARYDIPTDTGPRNLAFTGGKLWFSYGDQWDGNVGSVDPTVSDNPDPSPSPTVPAPTPEPTSPPSEPPVTPTAEPSTEPTGEPSAEPSSPEPSPETSADTSAEPSVDPSAEPTVDPTEASPRRPPGLSRQRPARCRWNCSRRDTPASGARPCSTRTRRRPVCWPSVRPA